MQSITRRANFLENAGIFGAWALIATWLAAHSALVGRSFRPSRVVIAAWLADYSALAGRSLLPHWSLSALGGQSLRHGWAVIAAWLGVNSAVTGRSFIITLPDDKPITAIGIIEDATKRPEGYYIVSA